INPRASNIRSTDWQFQALKSLASRYRCFPGFLAYIERRNQAVNRREFAMVIDACSDRFKQFASGEVRIVDRNTLQTLEKGFSSELEILRDQQAVLERQQFSTETKSGVTAIWEIFPNDSRYQALTTLIKRYGCVVGSEFSALQALTRMQYATALNACIDRVNEVIAASTADVVKREDLEMLQKLQQEFALELQILRDQVGQLIPSGGRFSGNLRSQVVFAVSPEMEVKRTDWEFRELQALSQRYSCSIDFLNKPQPVTRIEFAAKLSGCLGHINELIGKRVDSVEKADILRFERLSEVFSAELMTLVEPERVEPRRPQIKSD
ncbi:hypothetical protein IQ250_26745, partial [Pseudanabaenaceae cyanobacterium LEGE 13415]|nr:hypothetical protein [Pseudanabaenaceae cyanobacterium LEGE 13415]